METVAASAAAFALYYVLKQRTTCAAVPEQTAPVVLEASRETFVTMEHAPNNWMEALHYFKEVFKLMYTETLGRWHTVDLFVGLAYLSHKEQARWPASDIAHKGRQINLQSSREANMQLREELAEIRVYMLYCRGLKFKRADVQARFWIDNTGIDASQILVQHATAGLLRPAYVMIRDDKLKKVVLCIRGTQSMKDLFTSLTGATKPHHVVTHEGVTLGYSHLGMLAAARWLVKQAVPQLKHALETVGPGYELRIVGHSMGAGTAVMLTMMLRDLGPEFADTRCVAIACPACMTLELANSCKSFVTSVINGTDIVPTFCAASVDALREDITTSSWFVEFQRDLRTSVYKAVQGGVRGLGSATQWTARNILAPATLPLAACYTRTAATCGPSAAALRRAANAGGEYAGREPFFLPAQSSAARAQWRQGGPEQQPGPSSNQQQDPGHQRSSQQEEQEQGQPQLPVSHAPGDASTKQTNDRERHLFRGLLLQQQQQHRSSSDGGDDPADMQSNALSEEALEQTLRSCLYAAQNSHPPTHGPHIAAAIQLLDGGSGSPLPEPRNGPRTPAGGSPKTPPIGTSHMLASEPDAWGLGGSGIALRRRLWPWGTGQSQVQAGEEMPLMAQQANGGILGENDQERLSGRPSGESDSRGLVKGGRDANGSTPRGAGGWGGWLSWMGLGQGTPAPDGTSVSDHGGATPASACTPTAHVPRLGDQAALDNQLEELQGAAAGGNAAGRLEPAAVPSTGMVGVKQALEKSAAAVQKAPGWLNGVFGGGKTPNQPWKAGRIRTGMEAGHGSPGMGRDRASSPGEEEDELFGDPELLMEGVGSSQSMGGSLGSSALRQQLQAGISAVVAAVSHEPEEEDEGSDRDPVAREAERVLRETGGSSNASPAPRSLMRSASMLRASALDNAAGCGSDGGLQHARGKGDGSPLAASGPWRGRSRSVSGTEAGMAAAEGLRARSAAARAAAAAEQAGMMEINVDGHLLQAPSAPGFTIPPSHTGTAGDGSGAGNSASGATRHAHKRLYPAGRILHFVPLHALEAAEDAAKACPATASHSRSNSTNNFPPVHADMPHRAQQVPLEAAAAATEAAAAAASRATGSNSFSAVAAEATAQGATWVLVEVEDPTVYGRVKLCRTMVMDHFVSSYLVALDSVVSQLLEHVAVLDEESATVKPDVSQPLL